MSLPAYWMAQSQQAPGRGWGGVGGGRGQAGCQMVMLRTTQGPTSPVPKERWESRSPVPRASAILPIYLR